MGTTEDSSAKSPQQHKSTGDPVKDEQRAAANTCIICLSEITERAVATPCQHLQFDFICLLQWLQASPTCPLCKTEISEVQHDFRDVTDYKRYVVPTALRRSTDPQRVSTDARPSRSFGHEVDSQCAPQQEPAFAFRRQVYGTRLYSLHVGSNPSSGYQEFNPADFAASLDLQSKAKTFLRRELQVFSSSLVDLTDSFNSTSAGRLPRRRGPPVTMDYMIEYITAVLRTHTLKSFDARAEELIADFIGMDDALLLVHELDAWLRSPFSRLEDWDAAVQYHSV